MGTRRRLGLGAGGDESEEVGRLESGTADQAAVDVLLREQTGGVGGFHGAAVEDAGRFRNGFAIEVLEKRANLRMHFLRLIIGGRLARADGPDGLVGDDDLGHVVGGNSFERLADLAVDDRGGLIGFALVERFAHADDGRQPGGERGGGALVDGFIRLAEVLTALGVTDDDVGDTGIEQHGGGNFARVGAGSGPVHIFSTHHHRGAFGGFHNGGNREVGRADENLGEVAGGQRGNDFLDEGGAFGGSLVHLPVAGDQNATGHGSSGKSLGLKEKRPDGKPSVRNGLEVCGNRLEKSTHPARARGSVRWTHGGGFGRLNNQNVQAGRRPLGPHPAVFSNPVCFPR